MDTLEDTRGIPSHGLFQHEQKARWTCVCWSYRRRLNWIFSYKSNDVATEAGVPVSVNSNWTSVPKLPQPKCLAAKGLKTFSLRWQCRLAIGHIQVPATGQPAGKTERNYPSQLQFNNSIKQLARYQVSLATPPKWIADQREREREWRENTGPEQGAGPGDTLEYCGPAHSTNTRNQPGLRAFQLAKPRPLLCQAVSLLPRSFVVCFLIIGPTFPQSCSVPTGPPRKSSSLSTDRLSFQQTAAPPTALTVICKS